MPLLRNYRGLNATISIRARENWQSTSYNLTPILRSNLSFTRCDKGQITRLLSFSNYIPFYFYLGRSYSSDRYSVCGKRPLAIAVMNAELSSFKNGEHNSESMSTIGRAITPLIIYLLLPRDHMHELES